MSDETGAEIHALKGQLAHVKAAMGERIETERKIAMDVMAERDAALAERDRARDLAANLEAELARATELLQETLDDWGSDCWLRYGDIKRFLGGEGQ